MKRFTAQLITLIAVAFSISQMAFGQQQKLIHYWDFNSTLPCKGSGGINLPKIPADYSILGNANLVWDTSASNIPNCYCVFTTHGVIDNGGPGTTINEQIGYTHVTTNCGPTSNWFVRTRNPSYGMQFLWYLPTTKYHNIKINYATEVSSTGSGMATQFYTYSLDSGKTWSNAGLLHDSLFVSVDSFAAGFINVPTIDLSNIPGVADNPKFVFRIMYGDTNGFHHNRLNSGNNRFDNITVCGDSTCPTFVKNPASKSVCPNTTTYFVAHGGGGFGSPTFQQQWQVNKLDGNGYQNIANGTQYTGVTNDTLYISGITTAMNGYLYRCQLTPAVVSGCGIVNSKTAVMTVFPIPTIQALATNYAQSKSITVCTGKSLSLYGIGGQTYHWSNSVQNNIAFLPQSLTYVVSAADANGCIGKDSVAVKVVPLPLVIASASDTALCTGKKLTLNGVGASTYVWTSSAGGTVINGTPFSPTVVATYSVVGTDVNGCTASSTVKVTLPSAPIVTGTVSKVAVCQGEQVLFKGFGAKTYAWSNGVIDSVLYTATATNTFTVTGTSANGCPATSTVSLTVSPAPAVVANATTVNVCQDASVTLTGAGALSYVWSNGVLDGQSFVPTSSNTYTVTGTDSHGCTATATKMINIKLPPSVSAAIAPTLICVGGNVTLTGKGGTSYQWSNGVSDGSPFVITASKTYTVTGTDAFGCTNIATIPVVAKPSPMVTFTSTAPAVCIGQPTVLFGHGGSSYTWTNGVINGKSFNPTISNTYTLTSTGANGCVGSTTAYIQVNQLPTVKAMASVTAVCPGGQVTLNGQGAKTYAWTSGVIDGQAFSPTATTTYTLTGTDSNGCVNATTQSITVNKLPIVGAHVSKDTVCQGNLVTLFGSGAKTYTWSNNVQDNVPFGLNVGGTYSVTGVDSNGCLGKNQINLAIHPAPFVKATATATAVCPGQTIALSGQGAITYSWSNNVPNDTLFTPTASHTYTVTGTDKVGCTGKDTVTVTLKSIPTISAFSSKPAVCMGDSVLLYHKGSGIKYTWNGNFADSTYFKPSAGGTYTVTVIASNGCANSASIGIHVNPLPTVTILSTKNAVCPGGSLALLGQGAATYVWSSGIQQGTSFAPSKTATYTVTGTDANGCKNEASISIAVKSSPQVDLTSSSPVLCPGDTMKLFAKGASTYTWAPATGLNITTGTTVLATPKAPITYTVTGTTLGCASAGASTITVSIATLPKVGATANPTLICPGAKVTLAGTGAKTYSWSNGLIDNQAFIPTHSATYTVVGMDSNGCKALGLISVPLASKPLIDLNPSALNVCAGATVSVLASSSNTASPNYVWSTGDITSSITVHPTSTTTYTLSIDNGSCSSDTSIKIVVKPGVTVALNNPAPICAGQSSPLIASGATTYSWSPISGLSDPTLANPVARPLVTTTYTVVGSRVGNCDGRDSVTVLVNQLPAPSICCGALISIGEVTPLQVSNISAGSSLSWSPLIGLNCNTCPTVSAGPKVTTKYNVLVTDEHGCQATDSATVEVNGDCNIFVPNALAPNGDNVANREIMVYGACLAKIELLIFDRWGNKVADITDQSRGWDGTFEGKAMNPGGYVYFLNATTFDGRTIKRKGEINLLR